MKTEDIGILIVDDEPSILETIADILGDEGYTVYTAANAEAARRIYREHTPDIVLLDIWMPDTDGITLLREWQEHGNNHTMTIMMSGHGNIETAVEATRLGAYDFLEKPLYTGKLLLIIDRALQTQNLQTQNATLRSRLDPPVELIGSSNAISELRKQALQLADKNAAITITGSAGSGKQQTARYIHQHGTREGQPFISINIAAMDIDNIHQRLLNNDKQPSLLRQADGGTLYIDEASQLPEEAQALLSHLLEHNEYIDHNGIRQSINTRLIFASRLPLSLLKEQLNPILFDQITIATLHIPDLREHSGDIPELLDYFSRHFADSEELPYRHFTLPAQNFLRQQNWTGNVREVRNLVQRLLIKDDAPEVDLEEAREAIKPLDPLGQESIWSQIIPKDLSLREAREIFEHQYLLEQFRHCDGNVAQLAGRVGMDRTNLYRKLRSLGIDPTCKPV